MTTNHKAELADWLNLRGAKVKPFPDHIGPKTSYVVDGVHVIVRDDETGYTPDDRTVMLLCYAPGWASFDIETPFPIVRAAIEAMIIEAGQ